MFNNILAFLTLHVYLRFTTTWDAIIDKHYSDAVSILFSRNPSLIIQKILSHDLERLLKESGSLKSPLFDEGE